MRFLPCFIFQTHFGCLKNGGPGRASRSCCARRPGARPPRRARPTGPRGTGPARRLIPPVAGLDLSPIAVLVLLQLLLLALEHLLR